MKYMQRLVHTLRQIPMTLIIIGILVITGGITGTLFSVASGQWALDALGYGAPAFVDGNIWSLFAGVFVAASPSTYLLILPAVLTIIGYSEYRYGAWRTLIVMAAAHGGAVVATALVLSVAATIGAPWALAMSGMYDIGFSNAILGVLGAVSAGFTALWRIRVRVLATLLFAALAIYAADIWDLTRTSRVS